MKHLSEDLMIDYAGGELNPGEAAEFKRHLAECAACREELAELQADLSAVREVFPAEPDKVFWAVYPVKLRERMTGRSKKSAPVFLPEWITALAGVSFAVTLAFMLATGKMYLSEAPMSYSEWSQSYLYQPVEAAESEDIVDAALAEVVEASELDFMPVSEEDIYQLLGNMSEEELAALFKDMEKYSYN